MVTQMLASGHADQSRLADTQFIGRGGMSFGVTQT